MPALKNAKHESVLALYIKDSARVGWRAYQAVYPKSSQRAAETAWSRLLTNAEFKARHDQLLAEVVAEAKTDAVMQLTEVLEELTKVGRASIQHIIADGDDTGDVVQALRDMAPEHAAAIKSLTVDTYTEGGGDNARDVKRIRIELHNKLGALSELRRHYEPDKHELTGKDGAPIKTEEANSNELARRIAFAMARAQRMKPKGKEPGHG